MANSTEWQKRTMRAILEMVAEAGGGLDKTIIKARLRDLWQDEFEPGDTETVSNGSERWWNYSSWGISNPVAIGAFVRDGTGTWRITNLGRELLATVPDPVAFRAEVLSRVKAAKPRAWLVRGSSVLRANLVPAWLDGGWCSLSASHLPPIEPDIAAEQLEAIARSAYEHLSFQDQTSTVNEIIEFVTRMKAGDRIVTSDGGVFIGELGDGWDYHQSEEGRSNLRRPVTWRNPQSGIDFTDLPASLQSKLRTGASVVDITGELANIDARTTPAESHDHPALDTDDPEVVEVVAHEQFARLDSGVAAELLVGSDWLDMFVDVLNESRQVVLYGPPGTGKTYLASAIAERLAGAERTRLVQFHPSYSYEDFFEGFRPAKSSVAGQVSLELRPGPLRELAKEASEHPDQAFVMIIDELNRANIAKVFGELYFLLEYRDRAVRVMYGGDQFSLPTNLYFIATMNTADRSIALLDAAMRRRFTFLELHPATEPTQSMLAKWLERSQLPSTSADLLTRLNSLIEDRDAHIGPSYFMKTDQSTERMRRVFATQIEPLLRETYYDRWNSVGTKFAFEQLWVDTADEATPAEP